MISGCITGLINGTQMYI